MEKPKLSLSFAHNTLSGFFKQRNKQTNRPLLFTGLVPCILSAQFRIFKEGKLSKSQRWYDR